MADEPMLERQSREQCMQGKVMCGVVVEAALALFLSIVSK